MDKKELNRKIKYSLRFLPDKIFIQIYYFLKFHKLCNFKNPKTYNEKLNWLKLHDKNSLYTKIVDKFEVKEYVKEIIGEEYIIPTLGVWDTFDDINFDNLPNQFVLKCTHDSEGLVIVKDKRKFDKKVARKKIMSALKRNFYYIGREWPYKNIKPRIIAEAYMEDSKFHELRDYKFFCFDGKPELMFIASDRNLEKTKFDYFDLEFEHLDIIQKYPNKGDVEKPINFNLMIELSKKLSRKIPHARIDFYEVNGKVYFGEITFYHFSGFQPFQPSKWDYILGEKINIKNVGNNVNGTN